MTYAKHILAGVVVVFLCAWCVAAATRASTQDRDNPVTVATRATGLAMQPRVETIPGGEIDWTRGVVCAVGIGKAPNFGGRQAELMAKRGAYIVAARNAALVMAGIRVGPGGKFENVRNGWIRADVTLTGFRELGATYDPATRTATARMELPVSGVRGAVSVLGLEEQKSRRIWAWPTVFRETRGYDVIVIDARGLACKPAIFPRIVTADSQCVFDATEALVNNQLMSPAARYAVLRRDANLPRRSDRNWRRCLAVKAARIDTDGALVLDQVNLDLLTCAPDAQQTLRKGKLVIVTDE